MQRKSDYIFVYGTLRRGFRLHNRLALESVRYIGQGKIRGRLYNLGAYPGAYYSSTGPGQVKGELYELLDPESQLKKLDQEEDFNRRRPKDSLFIRRSTSVFLNNGRRVTAWAYFLPKKPVKAVVIAGGDYRKAQRVRH